MIHIIGVSHHTAPLAARELLAAAHHDGPTLLREARALFEAREAVLLATCNRFELYLARPATTLDSALPLFSSSAEALYQYRGAEAVTHLFRVAAGLDSLVLGEHEIMGRVK